MNLMMLLEMAAQGYGDDVAFVRGEDSITYGQLYDAAGVAAQCIREAGVSHVSMLDTTSLAFPVTLFGAAWAGVPFVPLNYRLAADEIDALLQRVEPTLLVTGAERLASFAGRDGVQVCAADAFVADARGGDAVPEANWHMDAEEVGVLLFTSGTTGAPKAALLRHRHLVSYLFSSVDFGSALGQTSLVTVPPYHIAGVMSVLSSVYAGRKVVQLPGFNAAEWLKLARREAVTTAFLVPTMLGQIVAQLEQQDAAGLPDLSAVSYGGGKMPRQVIERAMRLLPDTEFTQAYGLTETSSTICILPPEVHRAALDSDDPAVQRRLGSVGRALPGIEIQIRDAAGVILPAGCSGEIFVRGEQVSGEYVGRDSALDSDGWFATRDGGELDEEGYLYLAGRADDVIVRGAENMSPGEIEDVLLEHEAVADVAVVGVPDEQWGEAVAAVVVLQEGAEATTEALQEWVRQHPRSSRVPAQVTYVAELPYNETGKLLRRVVRTQLSG